MADPTVPWGIPLFDDNTPFAPIQAPFNSQSAALNDALTTINDKILDTTDRIFVGTVVSGSTLPSMSIRLGKSSGSDALPFTTTLDKAGWRSNPSYQDRISPTVPGWYRFICSIGWSGNDVGNRALVLSKNTTAILAPTHSANPAQNFTESTLVSLNGTSDYVSMTLAQSSGVNLNCSVTFSLEYASALS